MPFIRFFCFLTACFAISITAQATNERVISIGGDVTEIIYALNATLSQILCKHPFQLNGDRLGDHQNQS
ncbi:hypothetical protein Q7Z22_02825 [Glaesserella parasuis]|nr:hypothetical protein [Glaesserella parasuis]MDP0319363.1 hypothetical protein [Glaesserella parasuis]